jgi:dTDP-4-amino-4,6-dideoxygalactose transaminase
VWTSTPTPNYQPEITAASIGGNLSDTTSNGTTRQAPDAASRRPAHTAASTTLPAALLQQARAMVDTDTPVAVPFVDLQGSYTALKDEIDAAMHNVLARSDFVLGAAVTEFEEAFAEYCDVDHAVGVDSGFSALELTLRSHGIGHGDEVITAANTFIATAGAIHAVGARPVLVDVTPDTYTIDPDQVAAAVTPATKALLPVHLYGHPADMDALAAIAERHGLAVFEDACQAHGARYRQRRAGSLGDAAAFSFYPSKNLGAFGDGGMIVTDDAEVASNLRKLRNLGTSTKYHHEIIGFNRRLDTLHAAVLNAKLRHLDADNASRRQTAALYAELLADLPVVTPVTRGDVEHVFHLYVIEVEERQSLQAQLEAAGVATGIHYPVPIHLQPAYRSLGYSPGSFPVTERSARRILSLPLSPDMPLEAIAHTAASMRRFFLS